MFHFLDHLLLSFITFYVWIFDPRSTALEVRQAAHGDGAQLRAEGHGGALAVQGRLAGAAGGRGLGGRPTSPGGHGHLVRGDLVDGVYI